MSAARISGKPKGEIHVKRVYLAGVTVADDCPQCGKEALVDLAHEYLPYPKVNALFDLDMGCRCGASWTVKVMLRVSLECI